MTLWLLCPTQIRFAIHHTRTKHLFLLVYYHSIANRRYLLDDFLEKRAENTKVKGKPDEDMTEGLKYMKFVLVISKHYESIK